MKILQVTNFFKPSWEAGGPVRSVYEICKCLVNDGHEVTVFTTDGFKHRLNVPKNQPTLVDGIKTYYFSNLSEYTSKNFVFPIPYYLPVIARKEIKNFDIIHIHEHRTVLAAVVQYYAKKYGVPYILQPRGSMPVYIKSRQKKVFDSLLGNRIVYNANLIISSSKIESDQYKDVFPDINDRKIIHIPNGISMEMYKELPQKGNFKKKFSINSNDKIILFLSRIHKRKGADILIQAFSDLRNDQINIKLIIAGPDDGFLTSLKMMVQKLSIEKDVIFTGPLYEKDKIEAYVDADVFVLPSKDRYESFGNVVLESLVCGTPVIVTNVCGVTEWINEAVCVVEPDKSQIKDAISKTLNNTNLSLKPDLYDRGSVIVNFGWNSVTSQIESVYNCILEFNNVSEKLDIVKNYKQKEQ